MSLRAFSARNEDLGATHCATERGAQAQRDVHRHN